jgi:hypothetical protein
MLKEAMKGSVLKADFTFKVTKFVRIENDRPYKALRSDVQFLSMPLPSPPHSPLIYRAFGKLFAGIHS